MDSNSPSWSGLRCDLLLNIANRLHSRIDRLCFRAVCYSWRSVLPPPSRRALKLPFPMGPNPHLNPTRRGYFNLVHSTVYCLQPLKKISDAWKTTKCWFIKVQETNEPGKVLLTDPLSRFVDSKNLSPPLPKRLNLLDYRVSEITKVYDLQFVGNSNMPELAFLEFFSVHAIKVAVCSEGAAFAVMAIHCRLSIWRKGDRKWTCINNGRDEACYSDVIYHNGNFYAVDNSGLTISVDLSLKIARVTPAMPRSGYGRDGGITKRLLSSVGDLFLLDRHFDPVRGFAAGFDSDSVEGVLGTYFHVYKLIEDERKWVRVRGLGNRAIFVGDDCSFLVSAQEFRGCRKNCIYYNASCLLCGDVDEDRPGVDAALFDMDDRSAKMLSGVFSYSGLFWPPPSWVKAGDALG